VSKKDSLATILLAEDDPAVRDFVSSVLRQEGYEVLLAENGRQSMELCRTHAGPIEALVTDVVMPEMNGRELAEKAKMLRPDLKVLFISGYVDRAIKQEEGSKSWVAFLEKPFTAESLLDVVGKFCATTSQTAGSRA
jgi:CheY-like chemotaxis protein